MTACSQCSRLRSWAAPPCSSCASSLFGLVALRISPCLSRLFAGGMCKCRPISLTAHLRADLRSHYQGKQEGVSLGMAGSSMASLCYSCLGIRKLCLDDHVAVRQRADYIGLACARSPWSEKSSLHACLSTSQEPQYALYDEVRHEPTEATRSYCTMHVGCLEEVGNEAINGQTSFELLAENFESRESLGKGQKACSKAHGDGICIALHGLISDIWVC